MLDLIEGLEEVESVKVDEYGSVFIFYTVTDDFMTENGLTYKHRVYEINFYNQDQPIYTSYAVLG